MNVEENMQTSDAQLLAEATQGSEASFTALYRRRQGNVYRFALHMTGDVIIAEDVTQEVFLELLSRGSRYDAGRGSVQAFLLGVARNLVLRRLEKDGVRPSGEMEEAAAAEDLLQDLTRRETIDQVRRAVLSLPAVYRETVVLCDLEELNYEDAAAALDCPLGTVRSRLARGRGMLAQKLEGVRLSACGV